MEILIEYLTKGGKLVYFPGNKTAESLAKLNFYKLSKLQFSGLRGEPSHLNIHTIEEINEGSSIVSVFSEQKGDLFQVPIYKYAKFTPSYTSKPIVKHFGK